MWKIKKLVSKGDYIYAVVPNHPKATKHGKYVLLHRVIMENYLHRMLEDDEVVHHLNKDRYDNRLSNLELLRYDDHIRLHQQEKGRQFVLLKCPECNKIFELPRSNSYLNKPSKYKCNFCSPHCRGVFSRKIQLNGMTNEWQKQIDECLQKEYRRYLGTPNSYLLE